MTETYTFDDILIKPKAFSTVTSRSLVNTETSLYSYIKLKMPVMSASMSLFDTKEGSREIIYSFAVAMHEAGGMHVFSRATSFFHRLKAVKSLAALGVQCGIAVSLTEFDAYPDHLLSLPENVVVSIDIANGAIIRDINWGEGYTDEPLPTLVIGNFGNPGAVLRRDLLGQIAFKVGIGSGTGCTTRVTTGVGAPQAWIIAETSRLSRKPIISDGGVKSVADFVKAVALGANLVMMGKLFAASREAPWKAVKAENGKWYKPYRGMASSEEKGVQSYIEGASGYIPYEDKSVADIMSELKDGLTSAMSYSDSRDLEEFWQKKEFLKVTPHTVVENGARLYQLSQ